MKTCSVVLTFESVDEILWCNHSNETSSAVLLHGTICFQMFYKMQFRIFLKFWLTWALLGVTGRRPPNNIFLEVSTISAANSYYFRKCGYVRNSKVNKIFVFCNLLYDQITFDRAQLCEACRSIEFAPSYWLTFKKDYWERMVRRVALVL